MHLKKKIALFIPTLGAGGAERTAVLLANTLADKHYDVTLCVADLSGERSKLLSEVKCSVKIKNFEMMRVLFSIPKLINFMRYVDPDIIISSQTHANIAVSIASKLANYQGKVILREVSTPSINLKHKKGINAIFLKKIMKWSYQSCDIIIPVSYGVKKDLENYLKIKLKNAKVIYDPVITEEIFELAREPISHIWFDTGRKIPVIVAVGRLTEAKNYELLITTFKKVLEKKDAHLMILGEGEDRNKLEVLIKNLNLNNKVDLYGFDKNPYKYMANCDLYVMSSKWEGLPGALIQALALKANIISTDCPSGPREILENEANTKLVNKDITSEDFSKEIIEMLGSISKNKRTSLKFLDFEKNKILSQYIEVI